MKVLGTSLIVLRPLYEDNCNQTVQNSRTIFWKTLATL